jgi:hypothetical protein
MLVITSDNYICKTNETLGATIGDRFYLTRERLNPLENAPSAPFNYHDWDYCLHTPWTELFEIYDNNYKLGKGYYWPYRWSHIENGNIRIQSFQLIRDPGAGDNLKRMYKNGVSYLSSVISAVGTTEANLLGLVFIPGTDRLNR